MIQTQRAKVASLVISASLLIGIAAHEGYVGNTYLDAVGVPTIGFGETKDVKPNQKTDPVRALIQLDKSINEHADGIAKCIKVPISQQEYDAYISLSYNIGVKNFCSSTLLRKLNEGDYEEACHQILRWNKAGGRVLPGLTKRRQEEYKTCIGE